MIETALNFPFFLIEETFNFQTFELPTTGECLKLPLQLTYKAIPLATLKLIDKLTYTIIQLNEVRTSPTRLGVREFQSCQDIWPYM